MNPWRALWIIAIAALLGLGSPSYAQTLVKDMPKPTGYVDDYAHVLSPDGNARLEQLCREVQQKAHAQVFLVTVQSTGDSNIAEFANDLFHHWGIGDKKTDRGVLVILAIKDRKRRIEVGYGLEAVIGDAQAGAIGRDMVPALQTGNYDEAARIGVAGVAGLIAKDAHVSVSAALPPVTNDAAALAANQAAAAPAEDTEQARPHGLPWIVLLGFMVPALFFLFIAVILILIVRRGIRGNRPTAGSGGGEFFPMSGGSSLTGSDSLGSGDNSSASGFDSGGFDGGGGGDSGGGGADGGW